MKFIPYHNQNNQDLIKRNCIVGCIFLELFIYLFFLKGVLKKQSPTKPNFGDFYSFQPIIFLEMPTLIKQWFQNMFVKIVTYYILSSMKVDINQLIHSDCYLYPQPSMNQIRYNLSLHFLLQIPKTDISFSLFIVMKQAL